MTMGIVEVASLAERVDVGPAETMISTLRRTSSAASAGSRSSFPSAESPLNDNVFSLHVAKLAQTLPESFDAGREREREYQLGTLSAGLSLTAAPRGRKCRQHDSCQIDQDKNFTPHLVLLLRYSRQTVI